MSKNNTSLLGELVASSDNPETLRAQLVEATVMRPDALQEIQRTVLIARNGGTLDQAAATRILFQVDLLVETTKVLGLDPTRLREVSPQRLEEIAATQLRPSPVVIDPTQQRPPPVQRMDYPATQRIDRIQQTEVIPAQAAAVAAAAASAARTPVPHTAAVPATVLAPGTVSAADSAPTLASGKRDNGISLVTGTVLKDRFVLKREIGRGGMGAVFAAMDMRKVEANDPEPMVAVKVLAPDFAKHPVAFVALQRESRRAQTLAHPNVATVYDFDRDGDLVFMTMELLTGRPLDQVIRETEGKGLPRAKALPILTDISRGLAYAHRKGLVHADLKPGNIFLTDANVPKVLDFGIARAVPDHTVAKKDHFDAGALGAYTPAYATSEMIEGADPATSDDVYALGIIAYELLTGRHPYQRLSGQKAEQRKLKPAPIKGLPRRQWGVIERSLSFNRAQRPQDATAFLKGLFGITKLQKVLIGVAATLAVVAAYFGYAQYRAGGPDIPFEQLPAKQQQEFLKDMTDGNAAWKFYTQAPQQNEPAWHEALQSYSYAWTLHARNRDTARALRELADRVLADHPRNARDIATEMAETSTYLHDYSPVRKLAPTAKAPSE